MNLFSLLFKILPLLYSDTVYTILFFFRNVNDCTSFSESHADFPSFPKTAGKRDPSRIREG